MKTSIVNNYSWLIKREFWENRAIWMLPAAIGAVSVIGALFFPHFDLSFLAEPVSENFIGGSALAMFGTVFWATAAIYSSWYLLESLYADRKDRSILFWKSLPISDTDTVLAKLLTAVVVIPLVYFVVADVTTLLVAFIFSLRYGALLGRALWRADLWLQLQVVWLYLIVTAALWFLPISAWLLIVSAWARRAIILWATLPPLAIAVIEYKFFGTGYFMRAVTERTLGYPFVIFHGSDDASVWSHTMIGDKVTTVPRSIWALFNPAGFISSLELWVGVALGAALLFAAIQLRMRRAET